MSNESAKKNVEYNYLSAKYKLKLHWDSCLPSNKDDFRLLVRKQLTNAIRFRKKILFIANEKLR